MKRIALTDNSGRWFNFESAEVIKEETYWNGNNYISRATDSQWEHESIYRTKGGKWILHHWSDYQGTPDSYIEISNNSAAAWLTKQEIEPHPACETEYNKFEII